MPPVKRMSTRRKGPRMDDYFRLGRYQIFYCILFQCCSLQENANNLVAVFAGRMPRSIWCLNEETNITGWVRYGDACEGQKKHNYNCTKHKIRTDFESAIHEWDLVCEDYGAYYVWSSMQMFGILVGALIAGQVSDAHGRKPTLAVGWAMQIVIGSVTCIANNLVLFNISRFLVGVSMGVTLTVGFVLFSESVSSKDRLWMKAFIGTPIGDVVNAGIAWLCGDWHTLTFVTNLIGLPAFILFLIFAKESPRWQLQRGCLDEAETNLLTITKTWNRRSVTAEQIRRTAHEMITQIDEAGTTKPRYTFTHLFSTPKLALYTVVLAYCWYPYSLF